MKQGGDWRTASANTYETQNKTAQMRPNQSRAILILQITPTTTWLFAGYPYTTGTQKAAKISNKNSFFNWVHSHHTELMNTSHSTNLFTNSFDHISTNGKAPLHSHINLQHLTIAVIAVASTLKASFVYSRYVQTKLMGQFNGKWSISLVYVLKPLITAIRAIPLFALTKGYLTLETSVF